MTDDLILRVASEPDLDELAPIHAQAFVVSDDDARAWLAGTGTGNVLAAAHAGRLVGGLVVVPMGQFFGGRSVTMAGVAGVAVDPAVRRRGYATRMIALALERFAADGLALSTLYASTQRLYRSVGYEEAGATWRVELDPRSLDVTEPTLGVRRLGEPDHAEMEALYRRSAVDVPGHLDRGPYIWERHRLVRGDDVASDWGAVDADGVLRGYVTLRQRRHQGSLELQVLDIVADGASAARRLWSHLADFGTLVRKVKMPLSPNGVLCAVLGEPPRPIRYDEGWLLRLLDVPGALRARGYAPGLTARLRLAVDDPLLPANHGLFELQVAEGRGRVERIEGEPDVRVGVRGLAALYTGFASLEAAAAAGRLEGSQAALQLLRSIFTGPLPWMPDSF